MDIHTKLIDLSQKKLIEEIREGCENKLSANTFNSLYLWQHQMNLSIYLKDNFFAVKCGERGENTWFFPCGEKKEVELFIKEGMESKDFSLCYISEGDALWLNEKFPDRWQLMREEESDEYICNIPKLLDLKGGEYKGVRHKVNRIQRENALTTLPISEKTFNDAIEVVSEWEMLPHHIGNNQLVDGGVSNKAIAERTQLDIDGVIVYIDDKPVSVFAGFKIDDDTVDVLVGKCLQDAPRGFVYYAICEYLKNNCSNYKYCNLEEDLGIQGIKLIKEGLHPEYKNLIWTAVQI
ncbi:MAG: phosphatidylglycerol lysyltransferase domain-containing protein [Clostridiales bacterium]|nr:phosphatidylglycerol lysyltransferase domain-containing protein [Clostridiales bacterium]